MDQNSSNQAETSIQTIETTLGDLIEAITNIAMESGRSEDEAYFLTSAIINDVFKNDLTAEF